MLLSCFACTYSTPPVPDIPERSFFDLAFSNALADSIICNLQLWIRLLTSSQRLQCGAHEALHSDLLHSSSSQYKDGIVLIYEIEKKPVMIAFG
ncbi:hypothetical protein QL285_057244 [Trifolium repens]|nr:hypothetical protein QL285_057244 [Trifolium repens]